MPEIWGALVNKFSVSCFCITIHPQTCWLKATIFLFLHDSVRWTGCGWVFLLLVSLEVSHKAVVVWRLKWGWKMKQDFTQKSGTSMFLFVVSFFNLVSSYSGLAQALLEHGNWFKQWIYQEAKPYLLASCMSMSHWRWQVPWPRLYSMLEENTQQWE